MTSKASKASKAPEAAKKTSETLKAIKTLKASKAAKAPDPQQPAQPSSAARKEQAMAKPVSSPQGAGPARRVESSERQAMIAQLAYFRAEKRGFGEGGALDDWLEAEREIDRMLGS